MKIVLTLNKYRVIIFFQAFKKDINYSVKYVSIIYKVSRIILTTRSNNNVLVRNILPNLINLILLSK